MSLKVILSLMLIIELLAIFSVILAGLVIIIMDFWEKFL